QSLESLLGDTPMARELTNKIYTLKSPAIGRLRNTKEMDNMEHHAEKIRQHLKPDFYIDWRDEQEYTDPEETQ
ncbi:MAG: hypothetical protein AAGJ35_09325, partial [Myxococcota bacterium]